MTWATLIRWYMSKWEDVVAEVVEDGEVVLRHDDVLPVLQEAPDDLGHPDTLVYVQMAGGLVQEVGLGVPADGGGDGDPLELPAAEDVQPPVEYVAYLQGV